MVRLNESGIGINYCPDSTSDKNRMLYASAKNVCFQTIDIAKVYNLNDASELTSSWLANLRAIHVPFFNKVNYVYCLK